MLYINGLVSTSSTINGKLFSNFKLIFSNFWLKTEIFSKEKRVVNIDQIAMCYISMDSSRQALQTYESFFFQIFESFFELTTLF